MEPFFDWYMGLHVFGRMLFVITIVFVTNIVKATMTKRIEKKGNSDAIFKKLFVVRIVFEVVVCTIAIWAAIMLYQLSHNGWFSLVIGLLVPLVIVLNHKTGNRTVTGTH